jgi:hypothetical protein
MAGQAVISRLTNQTTKATPFGVAFYFSGSVSRVERAVSDASRFICAKLPYAWGHRTALFVVRKRCDPALQAFLFCLRKKIGIQ